MILKKIRLQNYRNFELLYIELDDRLNIVIGDNAQGKTNLLESMFFLSTTRSHRIRSDKDLIRDSCESAVLECLVVNKQTRKLKIVLNDAGKVLYDGNYKISKSSEYIGLLNAVLFAPSDIELFSSSPKIRRRLMDIEIGKLSINYMNKMNNYFKLIKSRNQLLKNGIQDRTLFEVLEIQLVDVSKYIIKSRQQFIDKLLVYYVEYYKKLSESNDEVNMCYRSCINDFENIELEISEKYKKNMKQDLFLKATSFGIHREDLEFHLNGHLVNDYASQGQKRMMVLALKLALVYFIRDVKKESPLLLLDDVLSELDLHHQQLLFKLIPADTQTIITTTHIDKSIELGHHQMWHIKQGKIVEDKV